METKYIQWLGTGPISFELPTRGKRFTFKPKIRNKIPSDVWSELVDPVSGPAWKYAEKKFLRVTTPGGGIDVEEAAVASRAISPAAPLPLPSQDEKLREENVRLKAEVARLASRLASAEVVKTEAKADEPPSSKLPAEPEKEPAKEPEPEGDPDAPFDPHSMSVDALEKAIAGLSLDGLEAVMKAEKNGKARKGAIAVIEAEQERALERE